MQRYQNSTGVSLPLAVFLATDTYDYVEGAVSATTLLKPIRAQVLGSRLPDEYNVTDIVGITKSRMGTAIHDAVEKSWTNGNYKIAMAKLGYPQSVIDKIVVNPEEGVNLEDKTPVYLEQRTLKEFEGKMISGKFDFVFDGVLRDLKNTSTFSWGKPIEGSDYQLQGSIYRWLRPDIITEDYMCIDFMFWDWNQGKADSPDYPSYPQMEKKIPLLSIEDTEAFIRQRLAEFSRAIALPNEELPLCTDEELWRDAPTIKYYKKPESFAEGKRSTKNYDTMAEANLRLAEDGGTGLVVSVPGKVRRCNYCPAAPICDQRNELIGAGMLTPNDV